MSYIYRIKDKARRYPYYAIRSCFLFSSPLYSISKHDLKGIAKKEGRLIEYGKRTTFTLDRPDYLSGELEKASDYPIELTLPAPFVAELNGGRLVGRYGLPVYGNKLVWEGFNSRNTATLNVIKSLSKPAQLWSPTQRIECAVPLISCWNSNYFHWVTEALTRLEGVEAYQEETGSRPKLVVRKSLSDFQIDTLKMLGFDEHDLYHWDGGVIEVDRLVIPSRRREINYNAHSPIAVDWLRTKMIKPNQEQSREKRIYVSREDADSRKVVNQEEVMNVLEKHGFIKIIPSQMDTKEVIDLFSEAEAIVGPHGAGLTDIIYSRNAKVLEFHRKNVRTGVYWLLSNQVENWYGSLTCEPRNCNMHVSINKLTEALEVMFG